MCVCVCACPPIIIIIIIIIVFIIIIYLLIYNICNRLMKLQFGWFCFYGIPTIEGN